MPNFNDIGIFMTMVGPRRSGKSTLMKTLLKTKKPNGIKDKFLEENIFIICPTLDLSDDFEDFKKVRKYIKPDPQIIQDIMDEQLHNMKVYGKKRTPEVLIILDDCADNNILRFGGVLDTLAVRGRHFKISVIVSSQRLRAVSSTARDNSDYFVMFSPYNFLELEKFVEEFILKQDRKQIMKKIQEIFETPHAFITIDNTEKSPTKKLKIGFENKLIYSIVKPT